MISNPTITFCIGLVLLMAHQACHTTADERVSESSAPALIPSSGEHGSRSEERVRTEVLKQTVTLDLNSDPVSRKLGSCCRRYRKPSLDSDTTMSGSEAKNETSHSSCHSLLLATIPRRLHNKRSRKMCRKLAISVCSILETGSHASKNKTHDLLNENLAENNTYTDDSLLANRIKRHSNLDFLGGMELLIEQLNDLAILDTVETDGGSSIKNEILDSLIDVINNENMALQRPADYMALSQTNDEKYDFNESNHLARGSRSKRVKARSDVFSDEDQKGEQKLTEEKLMRKLQKGSKACGLRVESILLAVPGCVPKSIIATRCQGSCPSWSAPGWRVDSVEHVQRCTCCMPLQFKTKIFALDCPGLHKGQSMVRQISVPYPFKCMCRPCENAPEIKAEQPYDY